MTLRIVGMAAGAAIALVAFAAPAGATTPHVHQITTGNGETHEIAIGLCNANWETAGENFHENVHFGGPNDSSGDPAISITKARDC